MTLTDEEKRAARATDPRAAELLDRLDHLPPEMLERMHGAIRYLNPAGGPAGDLPPGPGPCRSGPNPRRSSPVTRGAAAARERDGPSTRPSRARRRGGIRARTARCPRKPITS